MSIEWQEERGGILYSVSRQGAAISLYANGVFHSRWNPDEPFAGGVWDCLSLPALYRASNRSSRVLLLGVGGGAVIRQLELLTPVESLIGVEIDALHLYIARHWFDVGNHRVQLIEADAIAWAQASSHRRFDLVIDDLFGHDKGIPVRAHPLNDAWVDQLRDLVTPTGIVVVNCADEDELAVAAPVFDDAGFRHGVRWQCRGHVNAIGVFSLEPLSSRDWSRRLESLPLGKTIEQAARGTSRSHIPMS